MDNITLTDEHLQQARQVCRELGVQMDDREIISRLREIAIWGTDTLIDEFRAQLSTVN